LIEVPVELELLFHIAKEQRKLMADITLLTTAVNDLTSAVASDDAKTVAALAAIAAEIASLQAGVGPSQAQIDSLTSAVAAAQAVVDADAAKVVAAAPAPTSAS